MADIHRCNWCRSVVLRETCCCPATERIDELTAEVEHLKAVVKITERPPLPARMADCGVYCKTAKELTAELYRLRSDIHSCGPTCRRAGCVNQRLREEVERLRVDAARYSYLRAGNARTTGLPRPRLIETMRWDDRNEGTILKGDALDAAIDAAMPAQDTTPAHGG